MAATRKPHVIGCRHICCMGTTGLVSFVANHQTQRRRALAHGAAVAVLRYRGYPPRAIEKFKRAVSNEVLRLAVLKPKIDAAWAVVKAQRDRIAKEAT